MPESTLAPTLNSQDFWLLAPEIILAVWGLAVLVVDFGLLRGQSAIWRRWFLGALSMVGGALAFVVVWQLRQTPVDAGFTTGSGPPTGFYGSISGGLLADDLNLLLLLLMILVVGMSRTWGFTEHWGEYYALILWSTVGMMLLIAAEELLILFLTLEMMTICLYLTTAFEKGRRRSVEGGLKYFVYGSVSSALFLFGLSLIYGMTGTTRFDAIEAALAGSGRAGLAGNVAGAMALLLILVGFGFKIAAVPFHQWAPDAYEGAPAPVTAWVATGSKIASVVALMKVLLHALGPWSSGVDVAGHWAIRSPGWIGLIAAIAALTMTFGNFAALAQRNFKRMLAYSSISHAGYILVGVLAAAVSVRKGDAAGSVLYYLVVYSFSTLGAFAVASWLARDLGADDIDDLNGLGARSPLLAVCLTLLMLSLIGMPPLAGFYGKFAMFSEALDAGERGRVSFLGLVALGLFNSVVSAFYYVRVLKAMFLREPRRKAMGPAPAVVWVPIVAATLVVVGFGVQATPLVEDMNRAASASRLFAQRGPEVAAVTPRAPAPADHPSAPSPALSPEKPAAATPPEPALPDPFSSPGVTPPEPTPLPGPKP